MSDSLIVCVALAVRHLREKRGLSQEDLALRASLDRTYVSGVERGVRNITLQSLDRLIDALGVTKKYFFDLATGGINDLHNK